MSSRIIGTITRNAMGYLVTKDYMDNIVFIPRIDYEEISKTVKGDLYGVIVNKYYKSSQHPVIVKLMPPLKEDHRIINMSAYLFRALKGSVNDDRDVFQIGVLDYLDDVTLKTFGIQNIKTELKAAKKYLES